MDKVTIITPCSRPQNLYKISESINIPDNFYKWIIVFDDTTIPDLPLTPKGIIEYYAIKDINSICGNAQRNYAIDMIKEGWVYFLDDDTILHKDFWDTVKDLSNDFISFSQEWKDGRLRLKGDDINLNSVDSANFVVHHSLIDNIRWDVRRRDADGLFAHACKLKSKTYTFIPRVLSIYNALR